MEMHQIRYFLAVAETLNFTRAAEQCNVSQPALTKAVKKLEDELGGPLFRRERNLTHLTDLGRVTKPFLEQTVAAARAARKQADNLHCLEEAPLRLGVMCTIGPNRLLAFFNKLRSEVPNLAMTLFEEPGYALVSKLLEGEIDLALIGLPDLPERCDTQVLYRERYVVACPLGHRFEKMEQVPLKELHGENYLARVNCEFPDHFSAIGMQKEYEVKVVYESEREDWIQSLVAEGHGCAVMPEYLPMMPNIVTRPLVDPALQREIQLVNICGRQFSPAVQAFITASGKFDWLPTEAASV